MNKIAVILMTSLLILLQGCTTAIIAGGAAGAGVIHDRRTTGAIIEDETIEIKAISKINSDDELNERAHINVTSYNSIVLLTGEAPTQTMRSRAEQLTREIPKVRRVHNEIALASPSAFSSRSSDTWITTKVKTSLFKVKGVDSFDPTRVKVVTENGVVFLMGLVSHAEESAAVAMASRVGGVQRIIKVFEYID
jgi:osmotically-inducible protein OsmY